MAEITSKDAFSGKENLNTVAGSSLEEAKNDENINDNESKSTDDHKFNDKLRDILKSDSMVSTADLKHPKPEIIESNDSIAIEDNHMDTIQDEGISCNESGSESDSPQVKSDVDQFSSNTPRKFLHADKVDGSPRRNISKEEFKSALDTVLWKKSKSQRGVVVGDKSDEQQEPLPKTPTLRKSGTESAMPSSIIELQAKLQQNGESEWKKRIPQNNKSYNELNELLKTKNHYNDDLSMEKSILSSKKVELDAAAEKWKVRVVKSDADKFTVAGRMETNGHTPEKNAHNNNSHLNASIPLDLDLPMDRIGKLTPLAKKFKGKSLVSTPEKVKQSVLGEVDKAITTQSSPLTIVRRVKVIPRPDDDVTFKSFYKTFDDQCRADDVIVTSEDFDSIARQSALLAQKKNVQMNSRRRHVTNRNPIKALASRNDICCDEYVEVITGVAEREKKRLNVEKLAKGSHLAVEALAGLASREDFLAVALKKNTNTTSSQSSSSRGVHLPQKDVMLLQVKGRRHIQTRLVEPVEQSLNEGDCFLLVTPTALYTYIGQYSNVIEQSRTADIANHIQQTGDLGCKVDTVIHVSAKSLLSNGSSSNKKNFWNTLSSNKTSSISTSTEIIADAGHPDEDELYESRILATNMIYVLEENELVPDDKYWGAMPKIDILQPAKVLVFDFGSEMYVWSGKNATLEAKRRALQLAEELWMEGYDYSECGICPVNAASILGHRNSTVQQQPSKKCPKRPTWSLFAKITQHRETILFKEKFLDWPDYSRIITTKSTNPDVRIDQQATLNLDVCNVDEMHTNHRGGPDLVVEGQHFGRGDFYIDEEQNRRFDFETFEVTKWRVLENTYEELTMEELGQFCDNDSYIVRWRCRATVRGKELLSGRPSKHIQSGRDRCMYFYWQGAQASINDKGCAAFLTVELDKEKAPQVRLVQGSEPAAFLRLFQGSLVIHHGAQRRQRQQQDSQLNILRLFIVRGEIPAECHLIEVIASASSLRSKSSFVLVDTTTSTHRRRITKWHGAKSSGETRQCCDHAVDRILLASSDFFGCDDDQMIRVNTIEEGAETADFIKAIGLEPNSYVSLLDSSFDYSKQPMKLFHLSSVSSGTFTATEVLSPHRSDFSSPYPFLQSDLYSANQPALFLVDNVQDLWLWQGWWPETVEEQQVELCEQTGYGAVRWQAERKAAMQTAVNYWQKMHSTGDEAVPAYLVWAGLEPLPFRNLFPFWQEQQDIAHLNLTDGRKNGTTLRVEEELSLLSRTTYPLSELLQRPLPEGVDPSHIENYLSLQEFQELLLMTREEFQKLPPWRQTTIKKENGLF